MSQNVPDNGILHEADSFIICSEGAYYDFFRRKRKLGASDKPVVSWTFIEGRFLAYFDNRIFGETNDPQLRCRFAREALCFLAGEDRPYAKCDNNKNELYIQIFTEMFPFSSPRNGEGRRFMTRLKNEEIVEMLKAHADEILTLVNLYKKIKPAYHSHLKTETIRDVYAHQELVEKLWPPSLKQRLPSTASLRNPTLAR